MEKNNVQTYPGTNDARTTSDALKFPLPKNPVKYIVRNGSVPYQPSENKHKNIEKKSNFTNKIFRYNKFENKDVEASSQSASKIKNDDNRLGTSNITAAPPNNRTVGYESSNSSNDSYRTAPDESENNIYGALKFDMKNIKSAVKKSFEDDEDGYSAFEPIYHEKQVKELCALHVLNNLFQKPESFTKDQLDNICAALNQTSWIKPNKSKIGITNCDINVLMAALASRNLETIWFDKRKKPEYLNFSNISGFILNVRTEYEPSFFQLSVQSVGHWTALREIHGHYYNLDSMLDYPQLIGKEADMIIFLREELQSGNKELFLVVPREVERKKLWLLPTAP